MERNSQWSQRKNSHGPDGSCTEFYQIFKKFTQILLELLHYKETEEALPNSFYEVIVSLTKLKKENHRLISLLNTDVKTLNKILAKRIQECIKKVIHHDQVLSIPEMKCWVPRGQAFAPPLDLFCTLALGWKQEQNQEQSVVFSNVSKDVYP